MTSAIVLVAIALVFAMIHLAAVIDIASLRSGTYQLRSTEMRVQKNIRARSNLAGFTCALAIVFVAASFVLLIVYLAREGVA